MIHNETVTVDVSTLTQEQKDELLQKLNSDKNQQENKRREAYEGLRRGYVTSVRDRIISFKINFNTN